MKFVSKTVALLIFILSCGFTISHAGVVREGSFSAFGIPTTVSIDNSTLTKIPTTQTAGRIGYYVSISSANAGSMVGFNGNCTSTSIANTVRPIRIAPGSNSVWFKNNENVCLWLITTTGSAENIFYQEMFQQE